MMLRNRLRGFTYLELLVVMLLISIAVLAALPHLHNRYIAMKERDLRRSLATIRAAIDRYHEYASFGQIEPWDLDWMFYPEDLEMLVEGVEVKESPDAQPKVVRFLRKIPIDPMTGEAEWGCRAYDDEPDETALTCENWYDVYSTSNEQALDGTYYNEW